MATYSKKVRTGVFAPTNPAKYDGDPSNIVYRSSLEARFMKWCDRADGVIKWSSEQVVINYRKPTDGEIHKYFIDFAVWVRGKDGNIRKYLVEIKPKIFTLPPKQPKKRTRRFIEETIQYATNMAKWGAARAACEGSGWSFLILTEADLVI